jgi:hypothetical protein
MLFSCWVLLVFVVQMLLVAPLGPLHPHSAFWRPDETMAPLGEPVTPEPGPKSYRTRNKDSPLFLYSYTVTTYRLPQIEMKTQQGSSTLSYINQNALPRDIHVRGSKSIDTTYHWAGPLVFNTRRTIRMSNIKRHTIKTHDTMVIFNQYASRKQIQDTQSYEITGTVSQNTTRNQDPKHHNRMSQHINNTKESSKHDQTSSKHGKFTKLRPSEEPNKHLHKNIQHSTKHRYLNM